MTVIPAPWRWRLRQNRVIAMCSEPSWATQWLSGQPWLQWEPLFLNHPQLRRGILNTGMMPPLHANHGMWHAYQLTIVAFCLLQNSRFFFQLFLSSHVGYLINNSKISFDQVRQAQILHMTWVTYKTLRIDTIVPLSGTSSRQVFKVWDLQRCRTDCHSVLYNKKRYNCIRKKKLLKNHGYLMTQDPKPYIFLV